MRNDARVLGLNKFERFIIIFVPIALGGTIGWFIPNIAKWILMLPIIPMEKLISFITTLDSLWVSVVGAMIGVVVGILFSLIVFNETLKVTLSSERLELKMGDRTEIIDKKEITAVYMENKQLIILGRQSYELYREVIDIKEEVVQEAFEHFLYPWKEKDPFDSRYERWVLGHPDFPEKINALLYARELALKENKKEDAKLLREDLAKLGAVIRDERKAQYVRLAKE